MEKPLLLAEDDSREDVGGLSSAEAKRRLAQFGRNEVPLEVEALWQVFLRQFTGTMPAMLILACVLSAAVRDWQDLAIIFAMLFLNASIAFCEETKATASLDALRGELKQHVSVMRDGTAVTVEVGELVPGDVVSLRGGQAVPADSIWISGDSIKLDTAALTGEPIPLTVPRYEKSKHGAASVEEKGDDDSLDNGRRMLAGCVVVQGECQVMVVTTGVRTEIGQAAAMVAESKAGPRPCGLFETKIMMIVKMLIVTSLLATAVVFFVQLLVRGESFNHVLLVSLSLVIGAVPIALPLVLQVTMALGARAMAEHGAIVTHTTALQEIASMTVLNSDKTGTLTTARMSVIPEMIWLADDTDIVGESKIKLNHDDCLALAALASNPANLEDPIDAAIFRATNFEAASQRLAPEGQKKERFQGFNPNVKRTVARYSTKSGRIRVAKGLLDKILDTGNDDETAEQWTCAGVDRNSVSREIDIAAEAATTAGRIADNARDEAKRLGGGVRARALAADAALSSVGYKTIAVCCAFYDEESGEDDSMHLVGLVPMLDPPRPDTMATIDALDKAGVAVKMITGDHVNIARETARLVGLGDRILSQESLWPASATRDETIWISDGFAQVMPIDKREVVLVLQNRGLVVGMTGDGVNDAAALAQAQVGIAVEGATDAATNAADIVLTRPGLSAIYAAVYESRLIFRRLRSYVLYRVAATVQIVLVLCALIFGWNDELKPIYVVLLALLNDVTMTPIAHDRVEPSRCPELPETSSLLFGSAMLGILQALASIVFYVEGARVTGIEDWTENGAKRQVAMYVQISVSVELLIFICRAPKPVLLTKTPSLALFAAVMAGNLLVSLLAATGFVVSTHLNMRYLAGIWIYDIAAFFAVDAVKVLLLAATDSLELNMSDRLEDPSVTVTDTSAATTAHEDEEQPAWDIPAWKRSTIGGGDQRLSAFSERASAFSHRSHSSMGRHSFPGSVVHERPSLRTSLRPKTPANVATILGGSAAAYRRPL